MKKIIIIGNSSSGKSTLAKRMCAEYKLSHLDLDSVAWERTLVPTRRSLNDSNDDILSFIEKHNGWVIEGCYTDLLNSISHLSNELIFINPSVEKCIENARNREWEPHKYESKEEQDQNLEMLIEWIGLYSKRQGSFSLIAHKTFYEAYNGCKRMIDNINE